MNRRTVVISLALIIIVAAFFRLYQLREVPPGLYPDEAMNGSNALEALHTGEYRVFYPENNGREGLFMNIQAFFLGTFGVEESWILRLPSAIFGILTVLGMYFLAKELFKRNGAAIGLLAAFLLAISFWHVNFSRIGFRAIMAPAFLVWAVYLFLRSIRETGSGAPSNTWRYGLAALSGLLLGGGMHSYIAYRIMPLLFAALIPFHFREKKFWIALFVTAAAALLAASPLFLYYAENPADFLGRTSQVSIFSSEMPLQDLLVNTAKTAWMFFGTGDGNWRHNIAGHAQLSLPVTILFLLGIGVGIRSWVSKGGDESEGRRPFTVLMVWSALAALPVVTSNEGIPHALRAILMIPPVIILAAWGSVYLYEIRKKYDSTKVRRVINGIAVAILLFLTFEAYHLYFTVWAKSPHTPGAFAKNYVEIGEEINALPLETVKYVIVEAGGVDVRGVPMPAQTVMFITDTFRTEGREEKNVHYILPGQEHSIPENAEVFRIR